MRGCAEQSDNEKNGPTYSYRNNHEGEELFEVFGHGQRPGFPIPPSKGDNRNSDRPKPSVCPLQRARCGPCDTFSVEAKRAANSMHSCCPLGHVTLGAADSECLDLSRSGVTFGP